MKNRIAVLIVCIAALLQSTAEAHRGNVCGRRLNPSTQQWEYGCYMNPPKDPARFVPDAVQPGSGGHSVWLGQTPSTPQPGQAANPPSASACGKLWVQTRGHWEARCLSHPPTDGTFIANQPGHSTSPQELRTTPPPAGAYVQTAQPVQSGEVLAPAQQPEQTDPNATNLIDQGVGIFRNLIHR